MLPEPRAAEGAPAPRGDVRCAHCDLPVPRALIEQLDVGGRLVIPVGAQGTQQLLALTRTEEGVEEEVLARVSFVPLVTGTG